MSRYLEQLVKSKNNLMVFRCNELVFQSQGKGIAPLIEAIDTIGRKDLIGIVTADRVVGKAAALLNLYMGAAEVHAGVISSGAKKLLSEHGVGFEFLEDTDVVKAKDGVVSCPFEKLVWDVADPDEAHILIRAKLIRILSGPPG
ncbi:unnamed protein product [marine sediment metagenome]|uniref:DUF1893 domain-containing protein n=1 Tax=marine sediment metagenome TaxID=412755 RepID=X0TIZ3_9ZZZZ